MGLTPHLTFAIAAAGIGSGFQHGYHLGVINQPQDIVQDFINETYFNRFEIRPNKNVIIGIFSIMLSTFSLGGVLGALGTAFFAEQFGRRGGLLMNNVFVVIACALLGFSKIAGSFEMLILGRFVIGVNCGLNSGLGPMYLTEISPVQLRGMVGSIYQLVMAIAILVARILGLSELLGTAERWPILFGLTIIFAIFMLITLPFCPEAPRFLLINRRKNEAAQKALRWLRGKDDVEDEMNEMTAEQRKLNALPKVNLADMCTDLTLRKPLVIAVVVMLSQQFSGVEAFIVLSTEIFRNAGFDRQSAIYATIGMGVVNLAMTLVSTVLVEISGRKTLLLYGNGGMMIFTLLLTICIALTPAAPWLSFISIICVLGFIIMFATGPGSIPWFLVTELFEQGPRSIATSIAGSVNWIAKFIVGLCFLPIKELIGEYTFLIFTILLLIFWIYTYYEVPETKGKTIEEITAVFK